MSTVMVRAELFDKEGMFDEDLRCCEDYDYWLRVSRAYHFLLVDEPLTIKEGGRDDQVSFQFRIGMDKLRIIAIRNLLEKYQLSNEQVKLAQQELKNKAKIYGNGCVRHNRVEEGQYYLNLAEKIEKSLTD
jgi:GT2 family glycosyltransferase